MTVTATSPVRTRTATIFAWLAVLVALPVAALSVLRAVPASWPVLLVQLLSFTPWLAIPAAIALVFAFPGRRRWLQILTGALLACQLFWLFPFDGGRPAWADNADTAAVQVRAMNINSEFGQADAGTIVQLVRENGVGLLTIQEHTLDLQQRLSSEGLDTVLPFRISDPTDDAAGSATYSRFPLEHAGLIPDTPFQMPTTRMRADSGSSVAVLEVTNVHVLPPVDVRIAQWRSDLAAVRKVGQQPGHRLLIGDFNATLDHSEFRDILSSGQADGKHPGLVDVAAVAGSRLTPTWPMEGLLLPGIAIDHMVVSADVNSSGYTVHQVPGTDHAAIMATLSIPAA